MLKCAKHQGPSHAQPQKSEYRTVLLSDDRTEFQERVPSSRTDQATENKVDDQKISQ